MIPIGMVRLTSDEDCFLFCVSSRTITLMIDRGDYGNLKENDNSNELFEFTGKRAC